MTPTQIQSHTAETIATLSLGERMLDIALSTTNLANLSEREIESLWTALRALNRFEKPLRLASERIEAKAFEADLEWLATDHG